ncbi:hypothetical protein ACTS9U_07020 [Empedobacter falsenii]
MRILKITGIMIIISTIIGLIIVYTQYNKQNISEKLFNKNLNGRVKLITSNKIGNAYVNNVEFYDINGNLKFYANVSFTFTLGDNNTSIMNIDNYLVVHVKQDDLDEKFIQENLNKIKDYYYLTNEIDFNVDENKNYNDISNIDETKNLEVWVKNSNGLLIEKRIYNDTKLYEINKYDYFYKKTITYKFDNELGIKTDTIQIKKFDSNNNITEKIKFGGSLSYNKSIEHFQNNKLIKEETYDVEGKKWSFVNYKYDIYGNKISEDKFFNLNNTKFISEINKLMGGYEETHINYKYEYDKYNNWVNMDINVYDKSSYSVNRKIEYYNFIDYMKEYLKNL